MGELLTRPECDACLRDLALILPRAGLAGSDVDRMLDLYFGLLRAAGLTARMLKDAAMRVVMQPNGGKARFFPDPGQLAELCAEDIRTRNAKLEALDRALAIIETPASDTAEPKRTDPVGKRLHDLAEKLGQGRPKPEPAVAVPNIPSTARASTNAAELTSHIKKKIAQQ